MAKDPVCGMEVEEKRESLKKEHQGKTYFFCSLICHEQFEDDPNKFISLSPQK